MEEADLHAGGARDQLSPRPISMEEAFSRQRDRIGYLRSLGQPWGEAVMELRDILIGVEDEEFWDGIPKEERQRMKSLKPSQREDLAARWAPYGWRGMPLSAIPGPPGPDGEPIPIYRPKPHELSNAYQIILRLAGRVGITWKRKRISSLGAARSDDPADQQAVEDPAEA